MKRLLILILVLAQGMAFGSASPTSVVNIHLKRTPMDKLAYRMRQHNIQIERNMKKGKLTKDQGKSLKGQVEAVRQQEIAFFKQNGTKTLTDAQITQLFAQLNTLSKSIPIK